MNNKQLKQANLIATARKYADQGFNMGIDAVNATWGTLIQNMSAELELTDEQTQKLMRISEFYFAAVHSYRAEGMNPVEFAEYMTEKSKQIIKELRDRWS